MPVVSNRITLQFQNKTVTGLTMCFFCSKNTRFGAFLWKCMMDTNVLWQTIWPQPIIHHGHNKSKRSWSSPHHGGKWKCPIYYKVHSGHAAQHMTMAEVSQGNRPTFVCQSGEENRLAIFDLAPVWVTSLKLHGDEGIFKDGKQDPFDNSLCCVACGVQLQHTERHRSSQKTLTIPHRAIQLN